MIEPAKFTLAPLGKAFKKTKTIEDQGEKHVESLEITKSPEQQKPKSIEGIFLKDLENIEIKKGINEIKTIEEKIDGKYLVYETNKYTFNFQQFKILRSLCDNIFNGKIRLSEAK